MSVSNQVLPSVGVGDASGHGLLAAAEGLLRSRRSLVVRTSGVFVCFVGAFSIRSLSCQTGPRSCSTVTFIAFRKQPVMSKFDHSKLLFTLWWVAVQDLFERERQEAEDAEAVE